MSVAVQGAAAAGAGALAGAAVAGAAAALLGLPAPAWLIGLVAAAGAAAGTAVPIRFLRQALDRLARLALTTDADPRDTADLRSRADELGELGRAISDLKGRVEHRNSALTQAYLSVMETEQRLSAIVDHMIEGVLIIETSGVIMRANPAAHRILGFEPGALCETPLEDLLPAADRRADLLGRLAALADQQSPGGADPVLHEVRGRDGRRIPIELSVTRIEQDGRSFFCITARDVTQRRRMEQELEHSRRFLDRTLELMPVAVFIKDAETQEFLKVNQAMERLTGLPKRLFLGHGNHELPVLDHATAARFEAAERDLVAGKLPRLVNRFDIPTTRGPRTLRGTTVPLSDEGGTVSHLVGVLEDLSEEAAARRDLEAETARVEHYLKLAGAAILEIGQDGCVCLANDTALMLLKRERDDLIGRHYVSLSDRPWITPDIQARIESWLAGENETPLSFDSRHGDTWVRWRVGVRQDPGSGDIVTAVGEDLTAVLKEKHRAEAANQAKDQFLSNMGHELRTPLNVILGYAEMLEDLAREAGRAQEAEDLGRIVGAGRRLLTLINEVLELARSESGQRAPSYDSIDVDRLVAEVRTVIDPKIAANGNRLSVTADQQGPCVSDASMVRTILLNLLGNSAKFTRDGEVTLQIVAGPGGVTLSVRDTGAGIAAADLERVFEPFVQADSSTSRAFGGSGLGLALCKRFCEQLGGRIHVDSEPGSGSTFTVSIPGASVAAAEAPPSQARL